MIKDEAEEGRAAENDDDVLRPVCGTATGSQAALGAEWALSEGPDGSRAHLRHVDFPTPFTTQPQVAVFLSAVNIQDKTDRRVCVSVESQNKRGFDLSFATWSDTRVLAASATWVAFDKRYLSTPGSTIEVGRLLISQKAFGAAYKLHKGKGDRTFTTRVNFTSTGFATPPTVTLGLSAFDILDDSDHRLALSLENVDKKGFTLNVGTWLETKVWSLEVTWIAFDNSFLSGTKGLQIASGRWPFKRTTPGYVLHEGTGNRSVKQHITYPRKFAAMPDVIPFFSLIDVLHKADHCVRTVVQNWNESGFDLVLGAWANSHVWSASCSYLAFGTPVGYAGGKKPAPAASGGTAKQKSDEPVPSTSTSPSTTSTSSSSTSAATSEKGADDEAEEDEKTCKVCMDAEINICFVPCGHLAVCQDCANLLTGKGNKRECPICKTKITKAVRIFKT